MLSKQQSWTAVAEVNRYRPRNACMVFTLDGRRWIYRVQSQSFSQSIVYFGWFKEIFRWKLSYKKYTWHAAAGGKYSWTVTKAQFSWTHTRTRARARALSYYNIVHVGAVIICTQRVRQCNETLFGIVFAAGIESEKFRFYVDEKNK